MSGRLQTSSSASLLRHGHRSGFQQIQQARQTFHPLSPESNRAPSTPAPRFVFPSRRRASTAQRRSGTSDPDRGIKRINRPLYSVSRYTYIIAPAAFTRVGKEQSIHSHRRRHMRISIELEVKDTDALDEERERQFTGL